MRMSKTASEQFNGHWLIRHIREFSDDKMQHSHVVATHPKPGTLVRSADGLREYMVQANGSIRRMTPKVGAQMLLEEV